MNSLEDITSDDLHSILKELRDLEQSPIEEDEANKDRDIEIDEDVENYID